MAARRDGRPARRTARSRTSSPDPTRCIHEDIVPGFFGVDRLGRRDLRRALGALDCTTAIAAILDETLAGDGALGRLRLVDQRRTDRPAAARTGARAASPSATGCSRGGADAKSRCRTIGDDAAATIYLYISSTLTAKSRRSRRRRGASQARMSERAGAVKQAFAAGVHHADRPARLRRPDLLRAGHPPRPHPARPAAGGERILQGDDRARRRTHRHRLHRHAGAAAGAAQDRRAASWPRRSSCRRRSRAGSTR